MRGRQTATQQGGSRRQGQAGRRNSADATRSKRLPAAASYMCQPTQRQTNTVDTVQTKLTGEQTVFIVLYSL